MDNGQGEDDNKNPISNAQDGVPLSTAVCLYPRLCGYDNAGRTSANQCRELRRRCASIHSWVDDQC